MIPSKGLFKLVVLVLLALAVTGWGQSASAEDDECVNCHTNAEKLRQITDSLLVTVDAGAGVRKGGF